MSTNENPPAIESLDELMLRPAVAEFFGVTEHTIDNWRNGNNGVHVALPYFRLANKTWYWRGAVIWFLNKQSERPDFYSIDRKRRLKEGRVVGRPRTKRSS